MLAFPFFILYIAVSSGGWIPVVYQFTGPAEGGFTWPILGSAFHSLEWEFRASVFWNPRGGKPKYSLRGFSRQNSDRTDAKINKRPCERKREMESKTIVWTWPKGMWTRNLRENPPCAHTLRPSPHGRIGSGFRAHLPCQNPIAFRVPLIWIGNQHCICVKIRRVHIPLGKVHTTEGYVHTELAPILCPNPIAFRVPLIWMGNSLQGGRDMSVLWQPRRGLAPSK